MNSINYDEISYAEIVTFMKVAQSLSMTIAAKELHISQPAISKRISCFEKKFGLILFIRTGRTLQLTPAGRAFYNEILNSQLHLHSAFIKAAAIQASPKRTLKLYYDGFFDLPLLYQIIDRFYEEYGTAKIQIYYGHKEDCSDLLMGQADLMLCPDSFTYNLEAHISKLPVSAFRFYILVAKTNILAEKDYLAIPDLLGTPLTVAHQNEDSPYVRTLKAMFAPYGFLPKIDHPVTMESLDFEIISSSGVGIASPVFWKRKNTRTEQFFRENIKTYPIENESYPVSLIWRANDHDKCLEEFIKCFSFMIKDMENQELIRSSYD